MSCCCSEVVDIGCYDSCGVITLEGYAAAQTGVHTLEIYLGNDAWQAENTSYVATNDMTIPAALINEAGPQDVKIKQPDGTYYDFTTGVDCARITTQVHVSIGEIT